MCVASSNSRTSQPQNIIFDSLWIIQTIPGDGGTAQQIYVMSCSKMRNVLVVVVGAVDGSIVVVVVVVVSGGMVVSGSSQK